MATTQIESERIRWLREQDPGEGDYVLYWMQQSQRARWNPALEFAVQRANEHQLPLVVGFGLTADYPEANLRHYHFLLEGLSETASQLQRRKIGFCMRLGSPPDVAAEIAESAVEVVCDRGYLRHQKQWRDAFCSQFDGPVAQVEADAVVPVNLVSDKREYAARTIRSKINRHRDHFLVELSTTAVDRPATSLSLEGEDPSEIEALLPRLDLDDSVGPVSQFFRGGHGEAAKRLRSFCDDKLRRYEDNRNQPATDDISEISPYLHFGQLSPVEAALAVQARSESHPEAVDSFLEELCVRRGLSQNYCEFEPAYDSYESLPDWARKTLGEHRDDEREHVYSTEELEQGRTHDEYWNAAMREMRVTGFMHNYMRMYWGKKILEWTKTPEEGFKVALEINNRWFLDGRDTNSYANVAWLFGLHDRAWAEREVFGKIRFMSASGLERKCDIDAYVTKTRRLEAEAS